MSAVIFTAAASYSGTYANVAAALNGLSNVTLLVTSDNTQGSQWARTWAAAGAIPWINLDPTLMGAGYDHWFKQVTMINMVSAYTNGGALPGNAVTAGTNAKTTALSGAASYKGIALTQI